MRNAVAIASSLLIVVTCVILYQYRIIGHGPVSITQRLAESPVFSFLPSWTLKKWAVPISREQNARVLKNVFEVFDPSLRSFLASVPIVLDSSVDTARAYSSKGYIAVSPDWDNAVRQSRYRTIYEQRGMEPDDPVFLNRFKTDLLIHEFLHILQARQRIDRRLFYEAVATWYRDPRYGTPSPNGVANAESMQGRRFNRIKYVLWHELFNRQRLSAVPQDDSWKEMQYWDRYRSAEKGVEEFAYIGQEVLSSGSNSENYIKTDQWSANDWENKKMRLQELSPEVIWFFKGIFNPGLTY